MANAVAAFTDNVPGNFFVDNTCIDCDLCRQVAPSVFEEAEDYSFVARQPESPAEVRRAEMALLTCPTGSIGTRDKIKVQLVLDAYPEPVDENVYFCGYASRKSYGASSYLIQRPEGNILIDSPRFARPLVRRMEEMGGVSLMLLTHQDDVADHQKFHEHFGCRRVIHKHDSRSVNAEQILEDDDSILLESDVRVIPAPGHTRGHVVFLYRNRFLFTGDHLAWSDNRRGLTAFRSVAWYSWPKQTASMRRLLDYQFEWVLPGHGRRIHLASNVMHQELAHCIAWMERQA